MKRFHKLLVRLREAPLYWLALSASLLALAVTRILFPGVWTLPLTEQAVLDLGFVQNLRADLSAYTALEGVPHVLGAHVLTRYLLAIFSTFTGDVARAGIWLSLVGVVATLSAMYALCRSIFPLREYAAVVMVAFGALGGVQYAISPDPSVALGMGLVSWGFCMFMTALDQSRPPRVFISALLIGLAGYIRLELAFLWVFLALYLLANTTYNSAVKSRGLPLVGMALGGLFMVALIAWPMIDHNLRLAGSPVLPGFDAEQILGAPSRGRVVRPDYAGRFVEGFRMLATDRTGMGIFAGLLWPVGLVVSTVMNRHKAIPFFWIPFVIFWLLVLTLLSPITGTESFHECLRITAPLLFPFAVLAPTAVLYWWLQQKVQPREKVARIWFALLLGAYLFTLLPNLAGPGVRAQAIEREQLMTILDIFERDEVLLDSVLLTDRPGLFLGAGKRDVYGLNGETDWEMLFNKYNDGSFDPEKLADYMRERGITHLHLARHDDPLDERLAQVDNPPSFRSLNVPNPHRVLVVQWPETD